MNPDDSLNDPPVDIADERRFPWIRVVDCLLLGILVSPFALPVLALVWHAIQPDYPDVGHPPCYNNLRHIGIALHNYFDAHRSLPLAYVTDGQGRRLHSWRAQLLAYIEGGALEAVYRYDEPWNGPNNEKIGQQDISGFICPDGASKDKQRQQGEIDYAAVVGPETMWPPDRAMKFDDVGDGLSNTIMQVEAYHNNLRWIAPVDLELYLDNLSVNAPHGAGIRSAHRGGLNAMYGDGSVHFIAETVDPAVLKARLTANGNEKLRIGDTDPAPPKRRK